MTHNGQPDVLEFKDMGGGVIVAGDADDIKFIIAVELRLERSRHH